MKQLLTRQQVQKEVHPTSYRPHLPHQAPDVWVWKTTLSPKATFKHSDHKQHTDAGEKARVCKTEVQEVFTKLSTSSRPWRLPGPGTAGRVLCQTDRKTLLHSIPGIGYVGKAVPRQGQGLQNAEDERESLVMPPKGRTQGKGKTQQHHDRRDQACRLKHPLQLLHRAHEEDGAPNRCDVTKGIKHCEEVQALPGHPEQESPQQ